MVIVTTEEEEKKCLLEITLAINRTRDKDRYFFFVVAVIAVEVLSFSLPIFFFQFYFSLADSLLAFRLLSGLLSTCLHNDFSFSKRIIIIIFCYVWLAVSSQKSCRHKWQQFQQRNKIDIYLIILLCSLIRVKLPCYYTDKYHYYHNNEFYIKKGGAIKKNDSKFN